MKATLEFNLPENNTEFLDATNGWRYRAACRDMDEWLRAQIKYHDAPEFATKARNELWEIMKNNGVDHSVQFD